jgi:hypothetical protein
MEVEPFDEAERLADKFVLWLQFMTKKMQLNRTSFNSICFRPLNPL